MKSIQKTFGTRKQYKPGELVTIGNCVFKIVKNRSGLPDCFACNLDLDQVRKYCCYCTVHINLQGYYLKLIKHKG